MSTGVSNGRRRPAVGPDLRLLERSTRCQRLVNSRLPFIAAPAPDAHFRMRRRPRQAPRQARGRPPGQASARLWVRLARTGRRSLAGTVRHTSWPAEQRRSLAGRAGQQSTSQPGQHSTSQPGQHSASQPGQHSTSQPGQHSTSQPKGHTAPGPGRHLSSSPDLSPRAGRAGLRRPRPAPPRRPGMTSRSRRLRPRWDSRP